MSRLDELTQLAIEGALSSTEESELEAMLAGSEETRRRYQELLDVEIALRGFDERLDVSEAVMARLEKKAVPKLVALPKPRPKPAELVAKDRFEGRVERWTLRMVVPATLVAAIVLVFALIQDPDGFEAPALASSSGDVSVMRHGKAILKPDRRTLQAGDRVVVSSEGGSELAYGDATRVSLGGGTELRLRARSERSGESSKTLELIAGTLTAKVSAQPSEQPLVVKTPHAEAVVRGTRFTLNSGGDRTRLEVTEGRVDFFPAGSGEPAEVSAGHFVEASGSEDAVALSAVRPLRSHEGLLALYTFEEGTGRVVRDRSESGEPLDLHFTGKGSDSPRWLPGGGIRIEGGGYLASREAARKIIEECRESGELTVETWIEPSLEAFGPSRVVTLSLASARLNFLLGQGTTRRGEDDRFVARVRSSNEVENFLAPARSAAGGRSHLVLTRDRKGAERIWLNGKAVAERDAGGSLETWHDGLPLAIGNDPGEEARLWRGACFFAAIYDRALSAEEIEANHAWGTP